MGKNESGMKGKNILGSKFSPGVFTLVGTWIFPGFGAGCGSFGFLRDNVESCWDLSLPKFGVLGGCWRKKKFPEGGRFHPGAV